MRNPSNFSNTLSFFLLLFLHLTDTVVEFEDSIMQKKMKIPKMSLKNSGNSIENSFGEERMPLRHKKVGSQQRARSSCFGMMQDCLMIMYYYCTCAEAKHRIDTE